MEFILKNGPSIVDYIKNKYIVLITPDNFKDIYEEMFLKYCLSNITELKFNLPYKGTSNINFFS